jgi:dihydroorotate dehydrogenase electron transfer subunit
MFAGKSRVVNNTPINQDCFCISIEAAPIAAEAKAGQFVNIRVSPSQDNLFRRPFSVFRTWADNEISGIDVVYQVVGRGTELLSRLRSGDEVDVLGPLGHGFEIFQGKKAHILLAGGVGAAGLFLLAQELSKAFEKTGGDLYLLLGARTSTALIMEKEFSSLGCKVQTCTEDGTCGFRGTVIDLLKEYVGRHGASDCAIYACGPEAMYLPLAAYCRESRIPTQIMMERHMMCGLGACITCVCKVSKNGISKHRDIKLTHTQFVSDDDVGHALVCSDGPVFYLDEVVLDE